MKPCVHTTDERTDGRLAGLGAKEVNFVSLLIRARRGQSQVAPRYHRFIKVRTALVAEDRPEDTTNPTGWAKISNTLFKFVAPLEEVRGTCPSPLRRWFRGLCQLAGVILSRWEVSLKRTV